MSTAANELYLLDNLFFMMFTKIGDAANIDKGLQRRLLTHVIQCRDQITEQMPRGNVEVVHSKMQALAIKIEEVLIEKGLKRKDFAVLMSVQPSVVTRWLTGFHNFSLETLLEIEEKLQCRLIDIEKNSITHGTKKD